MSKDIGEFFYSIKRFKKFFFDKGKVKNYEILIP